MRSCYLYDLNKLKTEPWILNQDERRVITMLWSMVSKAAETSRRQMHDTFLCFCCSDEMVMNVQQGSFSGMMFTVDRRLRIK